jgi:hypothetical protein
MTQQPRRCIPLFLMLVGTVATACTSIFILGIVVVDITPIATAWVLPTTSTTSTSTSTKTTRRRNNNHQNNQHCLFYSNRRQQSHASSCVRLSMSMAGGKPTSEEETKSSSSLLLSFLDDEEWKTVKELYTQATAEAEVADENENDEKNTFQDAAEKIFPSLSPALIMKLRNGEELIAMSKSKIDDNDNDKDDKQQQQQQSQQLLLLNMFLDLSKALNAMTDRRLEDARNTLEQLLNAGEIKKLDALIGNSARNSKLDIAFFQVLQMNLRDASVEAQQVEAAEEEAAEVEEVENNNKEGATPSANRYQILQHIYTRCQEEVEKNINPGTALLNKLLRTDVDSIRKNQLNHYLLPPPSTIKSPDGKEITLSANSNKKSLVSHIDFCDAIGIGIKQIRSVEKSGARNVNAEIAANLVESIRTVAIEARFVIGEHYGGNSTEVIQFEESLEPVFRPTTPDSPYIQGE